MVRSLAVAAVLAGCTDANAQLEDLPELEIKLRFDEWSTSTRDARTQLTVILDYASDTFSERNDGDCATLSDDTRATFDDFNIELEEPGFYSEPSIDCVSPRYRDLVEPSLGMPHVLTIEDASWRAYAAFDAGTAEPRRAKALEHADWRFSPGETVAFEWSHPDDLALPVTAHYFLADGTGYDFTDVQVVGSEVHIAMPTDRVLGKGELEIMVGHAAGGVYPMGSATVCEGAASCTWTVRRAIRHEATID